MQGKCFIFSAPSGSGKTTIVKHLLSTNDNLGFSISASTRDRRGRSEENGKDYYFLSPEDFKKNIDEQGFVEWEQVYPGQFYGTLKTEIDRLWSEGKHVVFDVDVKGGLNLKKYFGDNALAIFVKCPSKELLEERLRQRKTETEESISARMFKVQFEMSFENQFDVTLLNLDLKDALVNAQKLLNDFLIKK